MTTLALFQTSTHPNASPQLMSADPQALDLTIYLDITDSVKFAWKAQRDIAERGATMEEVQAAIDARKPDFAAYVEPQKAKADIVIQVRPRPEVLGHQRDATAPHVSLAPHIPHIPIRCSSPT